jgi:hypothetical protein
MLLPNVKKMSVSDKSYEPVFHINPDELDILLLECAVELNELKAKETEIHKKINLVNEEVVFLNFFKTNDNNDLATIKISDNPNTIKTLRARSSKMFVRCDKLVGKRGNTYKK